MSMSRGVFVSVLLLAVAACSDSFEELNGPSGRSTVPSLTVFFEGDGFGFFQAKAPSGAGFGCRGAACGASISRFLGQDMTLTATPDSGSVFAGWGGPCSGTDPCVLRMESNLPPVIVTFLLDP